MVDEFGAMHEKVVSDAPDLHKGKFVVNFPRAIAEFENAMHKFPVKKVLYRSAFLGKGLEFDSYRLFSHGDDADLIDWGASLRANEMMARKYIEERDLNVYFLVDVSNSMLFGSSDKLKAEYAAEFVISLSHLIVGAGDRIGLVMFNDDVVKMLHASSNKNQFALFAKFLSDPNLYGGGFDLDRAVEHVLRRINSAYTVFILVSDFIKTRKSNLRSFRLIGSKFEALAVMIRDKFDENLPKTGQQFSIQDPYSGRQMILDPSIAADVYRKNVVRQKGAVKEMLKHSRIDLLELPTEKGFTIPVSGFLKGRALGGRV
jgi:uncharacterized protein (DUF58 family)